MKLKNLNFNGFVFGQSGAQGVFNEKDEYPHEKFYRLIPGYSFDGITFVAKTITLNEKIYPESSNTELREGYKLKRMFPKSIWFSLKSILKGYLLNAMGIPNPGAVKMFSYGKWQERNDAFQISVALDSETMEGKIIEARQLCNIIKKEMPFSFYHSYAIQINLSCPSAGHNQKQDPTETIAILSIFKEMLPEVPLIPKFNLLVEPETIVALKPYCDAFCISNTLAFGKKGEEINWGELFKDGKSPLLKHFGGKFAGGLSGAPLFPLLIKWLEKMEAYNSSVKIIAGGGILCKKDIFKLSQFKIVRGIALGSVKILRPWRMQSLINYGNKIFSQRRTG
jgi:dihydroorotate dehydrogenase